MVRGVEVITIRGEEGLVFQRFPSAQMVSLHAVFQHPGDFPHRRASKQHFSFVLRALYAISSPLLFLNSSQ